MWEYRIEDFTEDASDLITFLNQHGQDGWELAAFVQADQAAEQGETMREQLSLAHTLAVFKRQK